MMTSQLIFWPVIFLALTTLWLYVPMSQARVGAVKRGEAQARDFKLIEKEPPSSAQYVNAISNQYESPMLFYAVVLCAYVTANVSWMIVALAWVYAVAKILHVYVHVTSNNLRWRRPVFMVAYFALILLWLAFAFHMVFGN